MSASTADRRRNVVLLHCHDVGRFIGTYGVETVRTPNLDRLAAEGVVFERAFAVAPQCSPARAALLTGTYPQRNGVMGLTHEPFSWDLRDTRSHLAGRLKAWGYRTSLIGVQHESRVLPDDQVASRLGFDHVQTGGMADVVADRAIAEMERLATSPAPFYLQAGFYEPHRISTSRDRPGVMGFLGDHIEPDASIGVTVPGYLQTDEDALEEMSELQGAVHFMDYHAGRILAAIDRLGLRDGTLVIFTTDHGLALPRAKCTLYDPGLEASLLVRAPFRDRWRGRRVHGLVSHLDVLPTILDLIGLPRELEDDGESLAPVVEDGAPARSHLFGQLTYHTYYDPKRSVRTERHKLIVNFANTPVPMDPTQSWIRRTMPQEVHRNGLRTSLPLEMYDLAEDPYETRNLAADYANMKVLAQLATTLVQWMREVEDPILRSAVTSPRHGRALSRLEELIKVDHLASFHSV